MADTAKLPMAPVATEKSDIGAITGGSTSGRTVIGTVMVSVRYWPVAMLGLMSVARKLTEVVPTSA